MKFLAGLLLVLGLIALFDHGGGDTRDPYHSTSTSVDNSDGSSTYTNTSDYGTFQCTFSADYSRTECGSK